MHLERESALEETVRTQTGQLTIKDKSLQLRKSVPVYNVQRSNPPVCFALNLSDVYLYSEPMLNYCSSWWSDEGNKCSRI